MYRLVLLRHGESTWNQKNRFTGWTDVDLNEKGVQEAEHSAHLLKKEGFTFDIAYTSVLKRSIRTLWIVQDKMDLMWIAVKRSWRLNEKHYGALQGENKIKTVEKYGNQKVQLWRRGWNVRPPLLTKTDKRYPGKDICYKDLTEKEIPLGESLKDVYERVMPYWNKTIIPAIKSEKRVLIVAHGNSINALMKHLNNVPDDQTLSLHVPTGIPLVYEFDKDMSPIKHYYLGSPDETKKAIQSVKNQILKS